MSQEMQEAVARRVRALLAKTVENGATESEALAAAEKARALMDSYRLTMSDVELQAEAVIQEEVTRPNETKIAAVDYCKPGIAEYCGIKTWLRKKRINYSSKTVAVFLGLKSDVEMATYLYQMIDGAIKFELAAYQRRQGYRDRGETASFQLGMAIRIKDRLIEMARALDPVAKTASGTALVVVKGAMVQEAYDKLNLRFSGTYAGMSNRSGHAYGAGNAAGGRVNLGRPLNSTMRGYLP